MGQRNTLCMHDMLDLQLGQGASHFHHDHCILSGNVADYTNLSVHPGISAPGITAEQGVLFRDHPDRGTYYVNPYNGFQNFHAVPNLGLTGAATPSGFYSPCMFPSPSSRNFPALNNVTSERMQSATSVDEFGRSNQFIENIGGFGKRKTAEAPPGNQHHIIESSSSSSASAFLSLNGGFPQFEQSYEPVLNLSGSSNFENPEYQESGNIQVAEGSHRIMRNRSSVVSLHPEHVYFPHHSYGLQAAHMGQSLHPSRNMWTGQFGNDSSIDDGACSNWNYNVPMAYLHGRCLHSGAFELTNMGVPVFPDGPSTTGAEVVFNPTHLPNFHQHLSQSWNIPLQSYNHQVQMPPPTFQHPLNNLHPVDVNYCHGLHSGSRFPHIPSNAQQIFRSRHVHHAAPDFSHGSTRIMSSEDAAAAMGISGFYGVGNVIDQHHEMRLDIDQMSYEELLELGERIGDVKTGLTQECIVGNLKTSVHNSQTKFLLPGELPRFSEEPEACIICQVEYEEDEIIGSLDCGHGFHGECIKRWLLVKNVCPICKKTALAMDNSEG